MEGGRDGFSMHAVTKWGWSFLIKQHLFSCHPARVHTFWPGEERHMFRGCAVHYGIAPHMYPIPKRGKERRHMRAMLGDVAHGEQARRGGKMFQGQSEDETY